MSMSSGLIDSQLSGYSPLTDCMKIDCGMRSVVVSVNFDAGMILPRAAPARSGTMHSTSVIWCCSIQSFMVYRTVGFSGARQVRARRTGAFKDS